MPAAAEIRAAIAELQPGTRVTVKLTDGRELEGTVAELAGTSGKLTLVDGDERSTVPLAVVADVAIRFSSHGPE